MADKAKKFDSTAELEKLVSSSSVLETLKPQLDVVLESFEEIKVINNEKIKVYNDTVAVRNSALKALTDNNVEISEDYTKVDYATIQKLK